MSKPLSTFKVSYLHFESTSEPTEMAAKDILSQLKSQQPAQVFVVIYSSGFFVKSHLNHVLNDEEKSKINRFVSAGLLKNIFKLPFQDEFVLFIFYETVELKTEALLFLFPSKSDDVCDSFVEYLKTLILMKHCSSDVLDAIFVDPDKLISTGSLRSSSNFDFQILSEPNEEIVNSASDINESNDFSSNFEDYPDSKQNTGSTNEIINRTLGLNSVTSSIESLTIDDSDFPSDSEEAEVKQKEKSLNHRSFFNDRDSKQCLSPSLSQSLPFTSMFSSTSEYTDVFENPISKREAVSPSVFDPENRCRKCIEIHDSNGRRKSDISTSSKILNQLLAETEESEETKPGEENLFSWPEFVTKEIEITSSLVVEMTSKIGGATDNFSLKDKCERNRRLSEQYEWDERVNRLHYDAHKKNFKADEEGSILLYCCRQIPIDRETY